MCDDDGQSIINRSQLFLNKLKFYSRECPFKYDSLRHREFRTFLFRWWFVDDLKGMGIVFRDSLIWKLCLLNKISWFWRELLEFRLKETKQAARTKRFNIIHSRFAIFLITSITISYLIKKHKKLFIKKFNWRLKPS